jgi:uncharacterized membrane protein
MSSLYPARRIPHGMILIGIAFIAMAFTMGIGHFGFGVTVYSRNTGQQSSDFAVAILVLVVGCVGVLLALVGRTVLRAASRHNGKQAINANGR